MDRDEWRKARTSPTARRQQRRTATRVDFDRNLRCAWRTHECANDNDQMYKRTCNIELLDAEWIAERISCHSTRWVIDRLRNIIYIYMFFWRRTSLKKNYGTKFLSICKSTRTSRNLHRYRVPGEQARNRFARNSIQSRNGKTQQLLDIREYNIHVIVMRRIPVSMLLSF